MLPFSESKLLMLHLAMLTHSTQISKILIPSTGGESVIRNLRNNKQYFTLKFSFVNTEKNFFYFFLISKKTAPLAIGYTAVLLQRKMFNSI